MGHYIPLIFSTISLHLGLELLLIMNALHFQLQHFILTVQYTLIQAYVGHLRKNDKYQEIGITIYARQK